MKMLKKSILLMVLLFVMTQVLTGCNIKEVKSIQSLKDIENATIGVVSGTNYDQISQEQFPNAERKYFNSTADALLALEQGHIDTFFADKCNYAGLRWENVGIDILDEPVAEITNALIFAKEGYNKTLLDQVNAFIKESKENGLLERLATKWFGNSEPNEHPDYTKLTGENGTIKIAIGDSMRPVSYTKDNLYSGYEVDFLTLFAQEYGYRLDIQGMSFEAIIPSVTTGKFDIGASGITINEERKENVTFSISHFETNSVAVVRNDSVISNSKQKLSDFENSTIGIQTGTVYEDYAKKLYPNADRSYFTLISDMILAMDQGKIDGYLSEITYVSAALWEGAKIDTIDEIIDQSNAGYIFQKNGDKNEVREQLSAFIKKSKENGLLQSLEEKWIGKSEPTEFFDQDSLTGENGTLKVAVSPDLKPVSYIKDGEVVGYEVEVLQRFAKEYGYDLEFETMAFDAILPSVVTNKYDIGTGAISITEERAQSVDFSESHLSVDVVMVVKAEEETSAQVSFFDEIKDDFDKTFIREERWKLILEGIAVTMLISMSALLLGTLFGFALYMLSRSDNKITSSLAKGFAKIYSRIIAGTPVVVILMILFYVVFGKFRDMSGVVVAIIGFTLTFGAFVYDHMNVSVDSVNYGQTEAAYALGYTKNMTFFRIIFPQAMTIFLPSYCGNAVELIKATAVVGYIAVNDLTKMGDIIRSNTYEAFFPLIATAVIYFMLTWLISWLLGLVKLRFEPKRRTKEEILKGVKNV